MAEDIPAIRESPEIPDVARWVAIAKRATVPRAARGLATGGTGTLF